jgi:hypothetical protein
VNVLPAALLTYEQLRARVINSQLYPEGLAAIVYHGMARGLTVMLTEPAANVTSSPLQVSPLQVSPLQVSPLQVSAPEGGSFNRELLRLIANMVLQSQSEVMHVY